MGKRVAVGLLLAFARPAVRGWSRPQWLAVGLFALTLAGMNGFYYAAIALIPLAPAVTIEFIGPLLLAALLSRGAREFLWVGLAAGGLALLGWDSWTGESLDPWGRAVGAGGRRLLDGLHSRFSTRR